MEFKLDPRFFPLVFDTISYGIFTVDSNGLITSFNRMAQELTGYTKEEVLGKGCSTIFRADQCDKMCPLKYSIKTFERIENEDVVIETKSGRKLPMAISTAVLIDEEEVVQGGVEMFRDLSLIKELKKQINNSYKREDIVSKSPSMDKIFELLPLLANSQSTVLIEGKSGTGKELVARAIHAMGARKNKPFIAVNCAAIPDNLLESELFGYKKGAFTDAKTDKPGRFALAEGGTLFLDEVGEISPAMQVKLLRFLQEKEFEPLGGTESVKADVRVVSATNLDLEEEVAAKNFREDLYYRLNIVKLTLPPLSERREDIPLLIEHFIDRFNLLQGRRISKCSERTMSALMGYSFPGNVRELENAIEHAFVLCTSHIIEMEALPAHIIRKTKGNLENSSALSSPLVQSEVETIKSVLAKNHEKRKQAADELGVSRNTLWRKMRQYGISWPFDNHKQ